MRALIVGHGLAGALAAWHLHRRGCAVTVAEAGFPHTASRAAGALISPITGQRFRLMPGFDTLLGDALDDYRKLESLLARPLITPVTIRRHLPDAAARAALAPRLADPAYAAYLGQVTDDTVDLTGAWQLDVDGLLDGLSQYWRSLGRWRPTVVEWRNVQPGWRWGDEPFDTVIAAEGYGCRCNPWFADAPLHYNHGEALDVRCDTPPPAAIVPHDGHWALALGHGRYRVGATFHPGLADPRPLDTPPTALLEAAHRLLGDRVRIVGRVSGSRPVGPGRQPWLGEAEAPGLYALNGLGSKGSLFAPMLARRLCQRLGLMPCA